MDTSPKAKGVENASASPTVVRLDLAYDGLAFHGWQVQPDQRTVQGELVRCLKRLIPLEGLPPGAGRTDAGVHARGQVASFILPEGKLSAEALLERLQRALPRMIPPDMAVKKISLAGPGFHARHSARGRRYRYRIVRERDPFLRGTHAFVPGPLDFDAMAAATAALLGRHDFTSFCKASSKEEGKTHCHVRQAEWTREGEVLVFQIEADHFLHTMVRTIVGTLLEVGRQRRPPAAIRSILGAASRAAAGRSAPAHGLCLEEVHYDETRKAKA